MILIIGCQKALTEEQLPILSVFGSENLSTKSGIDHQDSLATSPAPTHKVLRITIESMEQLQSIERDTTIIIFHYCSSKDQDSPSPVRYYPPEENNIYICDAEEAPVIDLYPIDVYWPVWKNIPEDYKYVHNGDTYIPSVEEGSETRAQVPLSISGQVRAYDNRLNQYKPVMHAKIRYYSLVSGNLVLRNTTTDSLGYFTLNRPDTIMDIDMYLENSNFVVRDSITTSVKVISLRNIGLHPGYLQKDLSSNFFLDVYQAASYYFYKNNDLLSQITKYSSESSLDIFAVNSPSPTGNTRGSFTCGGNISPYITVFNPEYSNYTGAASKIFGTTLHELGHATHYFFDGYMSFLFVHKLIRESFASFFGWYNVKEYYSDVITDHASVNAICTQGRQQWTPSPDPTALLNPYSPFYIDLYDDFNQYYFLPDAMNDPISGVPVSIIIDSSLGHTSFQTVLSYLSTYVGQYYTSSEFSTLTTPYSCFL